MYATVSITLDTYSHAIPAMQEEAAVLIAGLVFADQQRSDRPYRHVDVPPARPRSGPQVTLDFKE